jgi:hypothetical protein
MVAFSCAPFYTTLAAAAVPRGTLKASDPYIDASPHRSFAL